MSHINLISSHIFQLIDEFIFSNNSNVSSNHNFFNCQSFNIYATFFQLPNCAVTFLTGVQLIVDFNIYSTHWLLATLSALLLSYTHLLKLINLLYKSLPILFLLEASIEFILSAFLALL